VLTGPHTFNFAAITDDAVAAGAALRVADAGVALHQAAALLADPARCAQIGECGLQFAQAHGGATLRTAALLRDLLAAPAA
jgi:3-deoxy-D-manno-octulosonic-acid transferase